MKNEKTVEENLVSFIAKIGEKITIGRTKMLNSNGTKNYSYLHSLVKDNLSKLAVIVSLETKFSSDQLDKFGKNLAMHIAAFQAEAVKPDQVPEEVLEKEKEVFTAQARESGKPDNIIEKMIAGRLKNFIKEICVESQPFVKDPQFSVSQIVEQTANELSVKINFDTFKKYQF